MSEAYDWLTLDDDEEILWDGGMSRKSLVGTYAAGVPMILFLGLGLVIIAYQHLVIRHTDYVITTKGVYEKTGVLSRSMTEIEYDKVQNSAYSAGPVGRYLGYGNVEISTAGGDTVEMRLRSVEDPQDVQKRISRLVKRARGNGKSEDGDDPADVLDEILDELRSIRRSLEGEGAIGDERDGATDDR